jgi:hypothetical protein
LPYQGCHVIADIHSEYIYMLLLCYITPTTQYCRPNQQKQKVYSKAIHIT